MFSPGSKPFMLACVSLYGRETVRNDDEMNSVIDIVKKRKELTRGYQGDLLRTLNDAFGFIDPMELME